MALNTPSLGLGYVERTWSAELGVRHDIIPNHAETFGVLSLKYFYDAVGGSSGGGMDEPDPM